MSAPYQWTGSIRRDLATGGIEGEIVDPYGFRIVLIGERGDGCYRVVGTPGPVPEDYRLVGDDLVEKS